MEVKSSNLIQAWKLCLSLRWPALHLICFAFFDIKYGEGETGKREIYS